MTRRGFLLALLIPTSALARSSSARRQFRQQHPCPATGSTSGRCPGYVVDHVVPLCAGGPDTPSNMQWQGMAESYRKDGRERALCRK